MKRNGFIASALLYGMLALFLTLMLTTLAFFANRKLTVDRLKESALTAIQTDYANPESILAVYEGGQKPSNGLWKDVSGHDNDAKFSCGTPTTGAGYLQFNGAVVKTPITAGQLGEQFSIVATISVDGYNGGYLFGNNNTTNVGSKLQIKSGSPVFNIFNYNVSDSYDFTEYSGNVMQIVINMGEEEAELFINGDIEAKKTVITNSYVKATDNLYIGGISNTCSNLFNGKIYDFIVYKGNLSSSAIEKNYSVDKAKYNLP